MREASGRRFDSAFRWDSVLAQYEALLERNLQSERKQKASPLQPSSTPSQLNAVREPAATAGGPLMATGTLSHAANLEVEAIFVDKEIVNPQ
jgi:hypothetical protein